MIAFMAFVGFSFFNSVCSGSLQGCVGAGPFAELKFLLLALLRPLFFTPVMVTAIISGSAFDPLIGSILAAIGTAFSALIFYVPGYYLGRRLVRPWLMANLPNTWNLIQSQDFKLIFITRWLPIFPFDIMSFFFGVANFHGSRLIIFSFLGVLPEIWLFSNLASPDTQSVGAAFLQILAFSIITSVPLLIYEFVSKRKGKSLWFRLKRVYFEILYEVQINNDIQKKFNFKETQPPVLLIYGFFSSRRTLSVMERLLNIRGYQVMSFNLGGVLGTFFTRGIKETAEFIDKKIRRQIKRHGFKKLYIVGHSKGGLVALWWLLRLGGSQYCDHVITMATPFRGSRLTYLALFTPLGFFWKDVWQMRPGSSFLKELHKSHPQENLTIYNFYSNRDAVATGLSGVFDYPGKVRRVPLHSYAHFEFLFKRAVADQIVSILNEAEKERIEREKNGTADRRKKLSTEFEDEESDEMSLKHV